MEKIWAELEPILVASAIRNGLIESKNSRRLRKDHRKKRNNKNRIVKASRKKNR
jgi:hypothetical protein